MYGSLVALETDCAYLNHFYPHETFSAVISFL